MNNSMECLYLKDTSGYDVRDENYQSSEEEREFYCEVCDREFPSEECLQRHTEEHQVCGIDDCVFSAHAKLVEKHISMQHSTGLYHRMKNLSTPEDIAKWIMERKKRYPTKANIEHLKAEASEKRQRYEIIRDKKSLTQFKTTKSDTKKTTKRKTRKRPFVLPATTKPTETQLYSGLLPFAGTWNRKSGLMKLSNFTVSATLRESTSDTEYSLIEDSDNEANVNNIEDTSDADESNRTLDCDENNTLPLSLVADYGTDSDKDNAPDEIPFKKIKVDMDNLASTSAIFSREECQNDNRSRTRNNKNRNTPKEFQKARRNGDECKDERRGQRFQRNSNENHNARGKTHKTNKIQLLNNLLSRSIQHERNLISQCIKYIVDNNYFE